MNSFIRACCRLVLTKLMKRLRVNEKPIYVIDITFGTNESIFSGNEEQKV